MVWSPSQGAATTTASADLEIIGILLSSMLPDVPTGIDQIAAAKKADDACNGAWMQQAGRRGAGQKAPWAVAAG